MIMPWKSSIGSGAFKKLIFLVKNLKISKNIDFFEFFLGDAPALRVTPSGNQVDGSPLVAIPNRGKLAHLGPANIHYNGRYFYVFSDLSYHELLVCYI